MHSYSFTYAYYKFKEKPTSEPKMQHDVEPLLTKEQAKLMCMFSWDIWKFSDALKKQQMRKIKLRVLMK